MACAATEDEEGTPCKPGTVPAAVSPVHRSCHPWSLGAARTGEDRRAGGESEDLPWDDA
jgi:hypothetical protein